MGESATQNANQTSEASSERTPLTFERRLKNGFETAGIVAAIVGVVSAVVNRSFEYLKVAALGVATVLGIQFFSRASENHEESTTVREPSEQPIKRKDRRAEFEQTAEKMEQEIAEFEREAAPLIEAEKQLKSRLEFLDKFEPVNPELGKPNKYRYDTDEIIAQLNQNPSLLDDRKVVGAVMGFSLANRYSKVGLYLLDNVDKLEKTTLHQNIARYSVKYGNDIMLERIATTNPEQINEKLMRQAVNHFNTAHEDNFPDDMFASKRVVEIILKHRPDLIIAAEDQAFDVFEDSAIRKAFSRTISVVEDSNKPAAPAIDDQSFLNVKDDLKAFASHVQAAPEVGTNLSMPAALPESIARTV